MTIEVCNENLKLLPEKAFYWEKEKLLGFSDVHLGKAESFQKIGIPLPSETRAEDLNRMRKLVEELNPKKVVILGDFIHDKESWTLELIEDLQKFFQEHASIDWHLVLGNHERGSLSFLERLPINLIEKAFEASPFVLTHGHLQKQTNLFRIEGHLHPVLTLSDGPLRMRFPCFVLDSEHLLLPSFGVLTGGAEASIID